MANIDYIGYDGLEKAIKRQGKFHGIRVVLSSRTLFSIMDEGADDMIKSFKEWFDERKQSSNDSNIYEVHLLDPKGKRMSVITFCINESVPVKSDGSNKPTAMAFVEMNVEHGRLLADNQNLREKITELELENAELREELEEIEEGKQDTGQQILGLIQDPNPPMAVKSVIGLIDAITQNIKRPVPVDGIGDINLQGIEAICLKLLEHDPKLEQHLGKLLKLAQQNALMFNTTLEQLDNLKLD